MESTTQLAPSATTLAAAPLEFWHLLSLDAPTVATIWTWFIAASVHVHLPAVSLLSMFLAVWTLYAADRLLDARQLACNPLETSNLEARHLFHHRHRNAFLTGVVVATVALAAALPHLPPEAIRLDLILGTLLIGYFILIHATQHIAHRLPKELAVGLFFAAATFIPTIARRPDLRPALIAPALLFAALCSLNCLYIYTWEHSSALNAGHLLPFTIAIVLAAASIAAFYPHTPRTQSIATTLSALVLLILHSGRRRLAPTTLRAAADLALTAPILLLAFVQHQ